MAKTIEKALEQAQDWLAVDGVEGVAQGERDGRLCIVFFTSRPAAEMQPLLPKALSGFSVVVQESGIIQAQ